MSDVQKQMQHDDGLLEKLKRAAWDSLECTDCEGHRRLRTLLESLPASPDESAPDAFDAMDEALANDPDSLAGIAAQNAEVDREEDR